ncbi:hypothetical protein LNV23_18075 [Paucibacter sp. DJ1R-11]|uniref:hypothetical protein n=1 Tax=Paucibacter sp. DJ1R-11 TaxID=2893556 RepID=UPI0021E41E09|nr:hypothetical protein [Paucibacter sp. DJ1R-11]MCV2365359.1 hypothetical protein [Paucibacter sp. DJ1R-11]
MRRSTLFHSFAPVILAVRREPQRPDRLALNQPRNPREEGWLERRSAGATDWMDRWILKPKQG